MDDSADGNNVNQPVELLPPLSQAADHSALRGQRQWDEQNETREAYHRVQITSIKGPASVEVGFPWRAWTGHDVALPTGVATIPENLD